jgi:hypothetical protein
MASDRIAGRGRFDVSGLACRFATGVVRDVVNVSAAQHPSGELPIQGIAAISPTSVRFRRSDVHRSQIPSIQRP